MFTNRPLRIVQVANVRWFNATAWYALFLSRILADRGHEVTVLGLPDTESFARAEAMGLAPCGLSPFSLNTRNPLYVPGMVSSLSAFLHEKKPDIVNCHRGESFVFFAMLKKLGHTFKLVRTRGDQRPPKGGPANRFLHNSLCDALIATNSRTRQAMASTLGIADSGIHCILGGVDRQLFCRDEMARQALRQSWGVGDRDFVVGLLGRFDPVKGHTSLMQAMGIVRQSHPLARLFLVGVPAAHTVEHMANLAREYGLDDTIVTGHCPDMAACISSMDLGVVASLGSEAIARAALEIMSCGVPLVGSTVGVMPDLLPAHALYSPGDSGALASLILRATKDQDWLEKLRNHCLERIGELDSAAFAKKTLAVYYALLENTKHFHAPQDGRAGPSGPVGRPL